MKIFSQAKPSQAKPSQAKPSQAKPSQAKPSQAKPQWYLVVILTILFGLNNFAYSQPCFGGEGALNLQAFQNIYKKGKPLSKAAVKINHHLFTLEVAKTAYEQENGLKDRKALTANTGIIYLLAVPRNDVEMYTKKIAIPLDMLFISPSGQVVCLFENRKPFSSERVSCKEQVIAVLGINPGETKKYNIKKGSIVEGLEKLNKNQNCSRQSHPMGLHPG